MKKSPTNKLKLRLAQASAGLFIVSALVLAVSGLLAGEPVRQQTIALPSPSSTPLPYCKNWPPEKKEDKEAVKVAFQKALDEAVEKQAFRNRLLDCNPLTKCEEPKKAVIEKLSEENPGNVEFPEKHVVIFYERDDGKKGTVSSKGWDPTYPPNHCYSILDLPAFTGQKPVKPAVFKEHFRCCYDPW